MITSNRDSQLQFAAICNLRVHHFTHPHTRLLHQAVYASIFSRLHIYATRLFNLLFCTSINLPDGVFFLKKCIEPSGKWQECSNCPKSVEAAGAAGAKHELGSTRSHADATPFFDNSLLVRCFSQRMTKVQNAGGRWANATASLAGTLMLLYFYFLALIYHQSIKEAVATTQSAHNSAYQLTRVPAICLPSAELSR